jgi:hypothetical protein
MFRQLCWLLWAVLFSALLTPAAVEPGPGGGKRDTGKIVYVGTGPNENRFLYDCPSNHWDVQPRNKHWDIKLANGTRTTDLGQLQPKMRVLVHFEQAEGEFKYKGNTYRKVLATRVEVLP